MITAVMIDSREPQQFQQLKFGNAPTVVTALECGDLWASTEDGSLLIIERKTAGDLLASIKDGRLFQQAAAMRQRSVWAYLVITGILADSIDGHVVTDGRATGWRWTDVQGALLTVQELGVAVVQCAGDGQYEETVLRLARRERCTEKALAPRTLGRVLTPAEMVLTSLPGIGLERAQQLLQEWDGRTAYALAWLTQMDTWVDLAGIGNGTKLNARRALRLEDDEWLTVFTPVGMKGAADYAEHSKQPAEQSALVGV